MLAAEWNLEDAIKVAREETWEKAWENRGEKDRDMIFNLMNQAKSMDELKKLFEASFS